jgi:ABC-2 type transport system ATP-binding protein
MHDLKQKRRRIYLLDFDNPDSAAKFADSSGFDIIEVNENTVKLSILGNVTELIKALHEFTVLDLNTETSSLEDIFMHYYGDDSQSITN